MKHVLKIILLVIAIAIGLTLSLLYVDFMFELIEHVESTNSYF